MGKPKSPDPAATAAAQTQSNRDTALYQQQLNMVDQINPFGSVSYTQTGSWDDGQPRYQQTTTYTPEQQAVYDQTLAAQGNLAQLANEQSSKLTDYLGTNFQFNNDDAAQWAYDLASPRLLQQQQQSDASLRATLAAKGIREGSAAWNSEMQRMTNANSDQLNQLALQGRGQAFSEAMAQRNQPINEITALLSGSQVSNPAQMSGATPQSSVAGTDVAGIYNQAYQNDLNAAQGTWGGIGGLFGTGLSLLSDMRAKEDIRRVGQTDGGIPIYIYRYKGSPQYHMGVMAQEIEVVNPRAVHEGADGLKRVDYSEVR